MTDSVLGDWTDGGQALEFPFVSPLLFLFFPLFISFVFPYQHKDFITMECTVRMVTGFTCSILLCFLFGTRAQPEPNRTRRHQRVPRRFRRLPRRLRLSFLVFLRRRQKKAQCAPRPKRILVHDSRQQERTVLAPGERKGVAMTDAWHLHGTASGAFRHRVGLSLLHHTSPLRVATPVAGRTQTILALGDPKPARKDLRGRLARRRIGDGGGWGVRLRLRLCRQLVSGPRSIFLLITRPILAPRLRLRLGAGGFAEVHHLGRGAGDADLSTS